MKEPLDYDAMEREERAAASKGGGAGGGDLGSRGKGTGAKALQDAAKKAAEGDQVSLAVREPLESR